jgi:uncharacterized protein YbjT (DUF2867 family)
MSTTLLTGATGFVGGHSVPALLAAGSAELRDQRVAPTPQ